MRLTDYIAPNCINPSLLAANKGEALRQMTHLLFEQKKMQGVGPALDQIVAREVTESTGIGKGIAVPHARVSGLKTLVCALGRVNGGIDFAAIDRKPVHLIFLICYPPTQQTTYLNFIATIAKLLKEEDAVKQLLQAEDAEAIHKVLGELSETYERPEQLYKKDLTEESLQQLRDAHADVFLLARLQLCQEMLDNAKTGKKQIQERMDNIRALVTPKVLKQYERLMKARPPALVPVEGDTCQGCFMKLPTQFAQKVRLDTDHLYSCSNCSRFIYMV
jgi:PTS system nitrogen regulatory IIA component